MAELYVITGFLGSGKTTFLLELADLFRGKKLAVLVNEFGKADVDGNLLSELNAALEKVHSGSIFCACRAEQFSDALSRLIDTGADIVLVETSGLSDPTHIHKLLAEHPKADSIEYRGCFCIADAVRFEKVYTTALVCGKQLDICDAIILNKSDIADDGQIKRTLDTIKTRRSDIPVYITSFGKIKPEWLQTVGQSFTAARGESYHVKDVSLQSRLIIINDTFPLDKLNDFLCSIAPATHRIKGFVKLREGMYYVDTVGDDVRITLWDKEVENANKLVVLAGRGLPMSVALEQARKNYAEHILSVE